MIWRDYELEKVVLKANVDATLWQADKGLVSISKNTLALPIIAGDQRRGYVFCGKGKLLLDTIVETEEGAFGRPVERELHEPFLMLGAKEELSQRLDAAVEEDLRGAGYENAQQFVNEAEALCKRFFERRVCGNRVRFDDGRGLVFAFSSDTSKLDLLVTKDSKLVFKKAGLVFVSNKDNSILKGHGTVILSRRGKSLVVHR